MRLHSTSHRIPRSRPRWQYDPNGPHKDQRRRRMATPEEPHRRSLFPGVHGILSILHPQLFESRTTPVRSNKESDTLDMDRGTNDSIRDAEEAHVLQTSANSTPIRQTIRSAHRRIGIWRGSHTLTRGRHQPPKTLKTTPPPHCILLSDIHTH